MDTSFNNNNVIQATSHKHLGIILDTFWTVPCKTNKTLGLIRKLQNLLPRTALMTLYKAFVRPPLDYCDILYNQAHNALFHQKLESLQYNACLGITGTIRGSSREKLCEELGFESLQQRRWYRKLCSFYKIFKNESPRYLFNIILIRNSSYITRNHANIPLFKTNHIFLKKLFFFHLRLSNGITLTLIWEIHVHMELSKTLYSSIYKTFSNPQRIMFLTRLRLGLSHLREQAQFSSIVSCFHSFQA